MSSGGICSWTDAWQRPDSFGKVLSHGGHGGQHGGAILLESLVWLWR